MPRWPETVTHVLIYSMAFHAMIIPFPVMLQVLFEYVKYNIRTGVLIMNIGYLILMIIGGSVGVLATGYLVVSMIIVLFQKIYGVIRYHKSLFD